MSTVKVFTSLAQDSKSINLLTLGHPVEVVLHHDTEEAENATEPSLASPEKELVTARATRLQTGTVSSLDLQVTVKEGGEHVVMFIPEVAQTEDYSLAVFCKGEHIKGSPFLLRYVDVLALSSVHTEMRHAITDTVNPINLILPVERTGEVFVNVEGPCGKCETEVKRHILETESVSVHFAPREAGAYSVCVMVDREEIKNSPFLILADSSQEEAQECYILPDDEWMFEKVLRFCKTGTAQSFHVSTEKALHGSRGPDDLTVLCSGPAEATVTLSKDQEGLERCEVVPTAAGDYGLSILWRGHHISGSPCVMKFRRRKSKIVSGGLNLHQQIYELRVPFQFKLNCSELDGSLPEVICTPATACEVDISLVPDSKSTYKCKLLPLQAGTHSISVKWKGVHVEGSPFRLEFKDSSNPSACKIVGGSASYEVGGCLKMKISTKGAGPGTLEVTAVDPDSKIAISLATTRIADDLYQLEFSPSDNQACDLSVTFNQQHIPGSPFRLALSDPDKFKVTGEGLVGGRVGEWNNFSLRTLDPSPGALQVDVEREDGVRAKTGISASTSPHQFEVRYLPSISGNYKIRVRWGQIPISGSPFSVRCSSALFQVKDTPRRVLVGTQLEFKVQLVSGDPESDKCIEVISRTFKGRNLRGQATLVDKHRQIYHCTLIPRHPGSYMVGVIWSKRHIKGSPFSVKAVAGAKPEVVRVSGVGVEGGGEVGEEASFTVDAERAGGGTLSIKVCGPSNDLKLQTEPDPVSKRTLHAKYRPTVPGEHSIAVEWAGRHVPGSPFKVVVLERACTVVAEVHPEAVAVNMDECLEEGAESRDEGTLLSDSKEMLDNEQIYRENSASEVAIADLELEQGARLAPPTFPSGVEPVLTLGDAKSVSVGVQKHESGYTSFVDPTHQGYEVPPVHRGSLSSLGSSTTSLDLYRVVQLDTRRVSDDQISIQLATPPVVIMD